ncbi:MAG: hypothetical protein IPO22_16145 [Anaerolineales bacterium]|nr:hypothetical protein [Anaerolineales bacterium]
MMEPSITKGWMRKLRFKEMRSMIFADALHKDRNEGDDQIAERKKGLKAASEIKLASDNTS